MALPAPPSQAEIFASVYGTWRLFIGDQAGLSFFGSGRDGFWRACWALAAVLPLNLMLYALQASGNPEVALSFEGMLRLSVAVVIAWYGFALAVHYALPVIDRDERFFDYMIADYWSSVPAMALQFIAVAIAATGLLSVAAGNTLTVVAFGASLWLRAQVARLALDVSWGMTIGVVVASLMFNGFVAALFARGL